MGGGGDRASVKRGMLPSLHQLSIGAPTEEDGFPRFLQVIAQDTCEICINPMGPPSDWSVLCVNGHAFHNLCIEPFLSMQGGRSCPTGNCQLTATWEERRAALVEMEEVVDDDATDVDVDEVEDEVEDQGENEDEGEGEEYVTCECGRDHPEADALQCEPCSEHLCDECGERCENCSEPFCSECASDLLVDGWCENCREAN